MEYKIKEYLEKEFHIEFSVTKEYKTGVYYIKLVEDERNELFKISVENEDNIRLRIICEPNEYGVRFVKKIQNSSMEQKNRFVEYWETIGEEDLKVIINQKEIRLEDFIENKEDWKKFSIVFNKIPFFDRKKEDKEKVILNYISIICAMILSLMPYSFIGNSEGTEKEVISKKYERDPLNRKLCLSVHGYRCKVCGFSFYEKYGEIGRDFIEVHHIISVSKMGDNYIVDPVNEMVPLCSNCHSMIHRRDPQLEVNELKEIIESINV